MFKIDEKSLFRKESITVKYFYESIKDNFNIKLISNKSGFDKIITTKDLHRPGLALSGFLDTFSNDNVQIFGNTELKFLSQLSKKEQENSFKKFFNFNIPCLVFTNNNEPPKLLLDFANKNNTAVFRSPLPTTKTSYLINDLLDDQFATRISIHGSFVDVYGAGILFVGKSGIGKSEVTLDLIERGHRFVADDVIILTKKGENILMGTGTSLVKHFMEIRGLGLINVEKMFGIRAIRHQKRLEIVVELEFWDKNQNYVRTGLDEETITISGVDIPYIRLPIIPGKNITVISEVISLNYLLKHYGYNSAKYFEKKLQAQIKNKSKSDLRGVDYFEHDFE
ncbi:MAG TPA: HPr kinase/phosphorylase [Ignavibacteria bacterium]|nr:HPr kinase/phosphorylase [Ignavibacteria bacterium]